MVSQLQFVVLPGYLVFYGAIQTLINLVENAPLNLHCNFCNADKPYNAMRRSTICKDCFAIQQREYRLKKKQTKVDFWLDNDLLDELRAVARDMDLPMRQVIQAAVQDYLEDMRIEE